MPVWVAYERDCTSGYPQGPLMIEADGLLLEPGGHAFTRRPAGTLGCPASVTWGEEWSGEAEWGVAEFQPSDDGDNAIHWKVIGGIVTIRVQDRVIVLDLRHEGQPTEPQTAGEGGAK